MYLLAFRLSSAMRSDPDDSVMNPGESVARIRVPGLPGSGPPATAPLGGIPAGGLSAEPRELSEDLLPAMEPRAAGTGEPAPGEKRIDYALIRGPSRDVGRRPPREGCSDHKAVRIGLEVP